MKEVFRLQNKWIVPNIAALLLVLVVNALATLLPINGQTTAAVSDAYPVLFTPAGYVFSIWGLIYLLLIAFVLYQAMPHQKTNPLLVAIGGFFVLNCLLNAGWIFAWHYNQILFSVLIMILLLISLIIIYLRITKIPKPINKQDRWFVKLPFSVYLGWICVATIANISIALYSINWGGWGLGAVSWTIIMLTVGSVLALYMVLDRNDRAFALVFVWAFIGIYVNQQEFEGVQRSAMILAFVISAAILFAVVTKKPAQKAHSL